MTEVYDFQNPPRLPVEFEQRVENWLGDVCSHLVSRLAKEIPFPLSIHLRECRTGWVEHVIPPTADGASGYRVALGPERSPTLFAFPNCLMLGLVAGVFQETVRELPPDREFSPSEITVFKYIMEEFVKAIAATEVNGKSVLTNLLQPVSNLKSAAVFEQDETIVDCEFVMGGPFGEEAWHWLIPNAVLRDLFNMERWNMVRQELDERASVEALIEGINAEVVVNLGRARLDAGQLSGLKPGDVVILDQSVRQPLTASVGGQETFHAWPGRVGARQAMKIDSHVKG